MDEIQSLTWFSGLFEGEGSFYFHKGTPKALTISMTDLDVLEKVRDNFGGNIYPLKKRKAHWKDAWMWRLGGEDSVSLVKRMLPFLGERRSSRGQEYIDKHRSIEDYNLSRKESSDLLAREILQLRSSENLTHQKIADRLHLERSSVTKILNAHGVSGRMVECDRS